MSMYFNKKYLDMFLCILKKFALILLISTCIVQYVTNANDPFIQEGEDADIIFSYHTVAPVEFELIAGNKDPFYKYGQVMADSLTPSQQKRLRVNSWYSALEGHMLVHMKFTSVERTDAGAYTCNLIENDKVISDSTQTVSLSVDFPPGPVICWVLPQAEFTFDVLQCAACGGSPPGEISCFQNNHKSPPDGNDLEANGTHILRRFWITRRSPVSCCSHKEMVMQIKNCKHFVKLFPSNIFVSASIPTDLPFETSPKSSQRLNQTVSYGSNHSHEVRENESVFTLKITYIVLFPVSTLILASFSLFLCRKFYNSRRQYIVVSRSYKDDVTKEIVDATTSTEEQECQPCVKDKDGCMELKEMSSQVVEKDKRNRNGEEKSEKSTDYTENEPRSPPITTEHVP